MMLQVLAFLLDTNGVVSSLETGIREHPNSRIPGDSHRGSSSRGRTDEDASYRELAQVGNIPGHQDRSDTRQASSECSDGKSGRRN